MQRGRLGIVTGLTAEASWIGSQGFMVRAGGGTPAGAQAAAEELVRAGAEALVSFGLAGGLQPGLEPGTLLVPSAIIENGKTYECAPGLIAFLGGGTGHTLLAGQVIAAAKAEKSALHQQTNAAAIDLESGAVARVATTNNLPFAALRAIADPASRNLPPAAAIALNPNGTLNLPAILHSILTTPSQIPALIQIGRDAKAAKGALQFRLGSLGG